MNKTFKIYGIVLIFALGILAFLELSKTEVIDWRKHYDTSKKTPFGLYIFHQEVEPMLHHKLIKTQESPFNHYKTNAKTQQHNILIINKTIDEKSWERILAQVKNGSDALIFSEQLPQYLSDTLRFSQRYFIQDEYTLRLTDKKQAQDTLNINKLPSSEAFSQLPEKHQILGYSETPSERLGIHFVSIPYGKGHFLLHTEPLVLTNYYLLKPNGGKHLQNIFAYLPDRETVWFMENTAYENQSPLRFILSNDTLRYAWWILWIGLLLFALFNAKRKQRIVPIIEPPKNKSLEFVKSIGNLYLQEGDNRDMMLKKAQYFLHYIRTELLIETHIMNEDFIKKLHLKTGKPIDKISEIISLIQKAQHPQTVISKEDLIKLNELIEHILK